jgi:hypothetical protein
MLTRRSLLPWLVAGDLLAIFIVTMIGFLDHYGALQGWRWLSTFIPVSAAWLLIAPWLGVYRPENAGSARQIWRPVLAALFSAPLAATLRGFWLNGAILPVFVLVLGLTNALGIALWRLIWVLITRRLNSGSGGHG